MKNNHLKLSASFLAVFLLTAFFPAGVFGQETSFSAVLSVDGESIEYQGEADYVRNPSIISIIFRSDDILCGYHFTKLEEALKPQSYPIQNENSPNFGGVCVRQDVSERERMATESGKIIIEEISPSLVKGKVEAIFKGGMTGNTYHLTGSFSAPATSR